LRGCYVEGNGYRELVQDATAEKPEAKPIPPRLLLERGGPWEVMPGQLGSTVQAAERYVERADLFPVDARARVREVWIEGKYRPAWLPETARDE
jgi:hypothetical protein